MIDIDAVERNIFPGAHNAIWQAFPWHRGAASPHSSQALAVSVFGTIAVHPLRKVLIDEALRLMFGWDCPRDSDWRVNLESTLPTSLLGERKPTEVDVLLENDTNVVFLECKFTEVGGGPCSQPKPLSSGRHKGLIQCDGNYRKQVNPVNKKTARCALSAKGIRYWRHIPTYFRLDNDRDHIPCPFAGPAYQYMRNVLAAGQWAKVHEKAYAAFCLVYVDGDAFPISGEIANPQSEWGRFTARLHPNSSIAIQSVSYQQLVENWMQCAPEDPILVGLSAWVFQKARYVGRNNGPDNSPAQDRGD